ncbi:phosphoadenosine phosphosulfate reductase family protein [Parendozoicomonas sp. Alg238-R29]|uniref:phosphoadenosine phosphosulfate reductase domain-containing protein n=1 Tax=Parendozoicomonas sp. Alg238-R29 TaxID=2993446 RepID=UPI00248EDB4D|nr:phosphoadenosine phosphosulfate reductase family protein [Parendozoicomonas sp. Alg238-R29]
MQQITILNAEQEPINEAFMPPAGFRPDDELEEKIAAITGNCWRLWDEGWHFLIAASMGKDSSVMTSIVLNAAVEYQAQGLVLPYLVVCSGNTLLENPVIDAYARAELAKVEVFIHKHNLPARVEIAEPGTSNNYLLNLIGGRTIATLPDNDDAKCSNMMKVEPITRQKKRIFKELGIDKTCTLVGTRFDESAARGDAMEQRSDSPIEPVNSKAGKTDKKGRPLKPEYVLSPIAHLSLDDIYYYIAMVRNDWVKAYSGFNELVEVYKEGEGGECMVNAYANGKAKSTGCGARFGCHICLRVQDDKSMNNMLTHEDTREKNAYMQPLANFRTALKAWHYDPARRNWLARTLNSDGSVNIKPNAYSPEFCEQLMMWALSIDADEYMATNGSPRFTLLRLVDVLAIDVLWNRYGYQQGLHACYLWLKVNRDGERWYPPEEPDVFPSRPFPPEVSVPYADREFDGIFSGFRDLSMMAAGYDEMPYQSSKGDSFMACNTGDEFSIDERAAEEFFGFEVEWAVERFHDFCINPTSAYRYLMRLGVVQIKKGDHAEQERMLRMANQIWRSGLRDCLNNPHEIVRRLGMNGDAVGFQGEMFAA